MHAVLLLLLLLLLHTYTHTHTVKILNPIHHYVKCPRYYYTLLLHATTTRYYYTRLRNRGLHSTHNKLKQQNINFKFDTQVYQYCTIH
jgi:hypothetical protein